MTDTMTQVRIPKGLVKEMDQLISNGYYSSKSDLIRDAIRKIVFFEQISSISDNSNSVEQVRAARNNLSRKNTSIEELNSLK